MKKFVLAAVLGLSIFTVLSFAATRSAMLKQDQIAAVSASADESEQEIEAALDNLEKFVEEHSADIDYVAIGRETPDAPWFARFYKVTGDNTAIGWNDEGFPTATSVVAAIEKNFLTHPDGHDETYGK
jgi:hypothetical protein